VKNCVDELFPLSHRKLENRRKTYFCRKPRFKISKHISAAPIIRVQIIITYQSKKKYEKSFFKQINVKTSKAEILCIYTFALYKNRSV